MFSEPVFFENLSSSKSRNNLSNIIKCNMSLMGLFLSNCFYPSYLICAIVYGNDLRTLGSKTQLREQLDKRQLTPQQECGWGKKIKRRSLIFRLSIRWAWAEQEKYLQA
uniref:Uncharacterized protein n=1 Tax=Micrurus corallinus TaxID=54390 RepID=A0A2D4G5N4_MICCO